MMMKREMKMKMRMLVLMLAWRLSEIAISFAVTGGGTASSKPLPPHKTATTTTCFQRSQMRRSMR
jgi:hypothetical protein